MLGISCLAAQLAASQEGLISRGEWVSDLATSHCTIWYKVVIKFFSVTKDEAMKRCRGAETNLHKFLTWMLKIFTLMISGKEFITRFQVKSARTFSNSTCCLKTVYFSELTAIPTVPQLTDWSVEQRLHCLVTEAITLMSLAEFCVPEMGRLEQSRTICSSLRLQVSFLNYWTDFDSISYWR
jgi:hypothetical protein